MNAPNRMEHKMKIIQRKEIKRLSKYFRMEQDELINQAWLIEHEHPGISAEALHTKLNSYCVEQNKTNGIFGFTDSMDDDGKAIDLEGSASTHTASVEASLIEREELAQLDQRIEVLRGQFDLLRAIEGYASVAEMARKTGLKEREMLRWFQRQTDSIARQQEMFS